VEKKSAEKKFMDIAAAKEVLTDDGQLLLSISVTVSTL
jgi:DnaJ-class molecular chaperone